MLGLKLWSVNTEFYLNEAKKLYEKGVFDYIELYVAPNTLENLKLWQGLKIPFALHAPHFSHGLNFSQKESFEYNFKLIDEVKAYAEILKPLYVVFHPGIGGDLDESIRQMKFIKGLEFCIENKPFVVECGAQKELKFCVGSAFEDIKRILDEVACKFCFDIGHCVCCANYLGCEIYEYVKKMNSLKPFVYHISDNYEDSKLDRHLHFGEGSLNLRKIAKIINKNSLIAIETNKDSKENLNDFVKDSVFLREILDEKA